MLYNINTKQKERGKMDSIVSKKEIFGGKPIIKGTRISVDLIGDYLNSGKSIEDIKRDYPDLSDKEIKSALDYIIKKTRSERTKLEPQAC